MKNQVVKSLKQLVVDENGNGQGLLTVKSKEVTLGRVREIIGKGKRAHVAPYPFKMVYKGKKYWMLCNDNGMMENETPGQFMPFTAGMMNVEFEYHDGTKAHPEDLKFNGIQPVNMFGPNAVINHFGPIVFIEDIGEEEIFSDYWENTLVA